MSTPTRRRGSHLPYQLLAGVVPCPRGWLVCAGKLVGINVYPEAPYVAPALRDVLDAVPEYSVIALAAPVGLPDRPRIGGRSCDREARRLLGWPQGGAIRSAPCRAVFTASDLSSAKAPRTGRIDVVTSKLLPRIKEVADEVPSYRQRTVFEAHPALSFYQLNDDQPLRSSKRTARGVAERRAVLLKRFPTAQGALAANVGGVTQSHVLDGIAVLWTARRIAARAVHRLPVNPEWNKDGLRMEILR